MTDCLSCGAETTNKKFCSRSCANSYNNVRHPKRERTAYSNCKICGCKVYRNRYCPECRPTIANRDLTLREAIYIKHHRSSAYALVRSRARSKVKNREQYCEVCGYVKHVEVCHLRAISAFSLDTALSEINDDSNLKLMCPNCHWEYDNL